MRIPGPVILQVLHGNSLKFDFMLLAILLTSLRVDHLRFVEVRCRWQHSVHDLLGVFGYGKALDRGTDESAKHIRVRDIMINITNDKLGINLCTK
jgi:hypothetical protein